MSFPPINLTLLMCPHRFHSITIKLSVISTKDIDNNAAFYKIFHPSSYFPFYVSATLKVASFITKTGGNNFKESY